MEKLENVEGFADRNYLGLEIFSTIWIKHMVLAQLFLEGVQGVYIFGPHY